eukprot:1196251-Prorocentrum_minimum.AAC.4
MAHPGRCRPPTIRALSRDLVVGVVALSIIHTPIRHGARRTFMYFMHIVFAVFSTVLVNVALWLFDLHGPVEAREAAHGGPRQQPPLAAHRPPPLALGERALHSHLQHVPPLNLGHVLHHPPVEGAAVPQDSRQRPRLDRIVFLHGVQRLQHAPQAPHRQSESSTPMI